MQQRRKSPEVGTTGNNHPDEICNDADGGCKPAVRNQSTDNFLTKTTSIMKQRFLKWWHMNNMMFSAIAGETFTNGQVVCTHIGLVVFLMVAIAAGN
jgi:hypothetical protein